MVKSLNEVILNIFKEKDTVYFTRFIGIEAREEDFNKSLKLIQKKCEEFSDLCIRFDNSIPINPDFDLIQSICDELKYMNINNLENEEIIVFDNLEVNRVFLKALQNTIKLAVMNENFITDSVRNNFITKMMLWASTEVNNIFNNVRENINPKCIYYGEISRHEIYFLILLYFMGIDVIYINPLKEDLFDSIDVDKLSICHKYLGIAAIDTFENRCSKVVDDEFVVDTIAKKVEVQIHEDLFGGTGMYKPWQFRNGNTESIIMNSTIEDLYSYYNEPAKLRDGFKVNGCTVRVPCFFKKIDGQYHDMDKYKKLLYYSTSSVNAVVFKDCFVPYTPIISEEMLKLTFYYLNDGTFDINGIKELSNYSLNRYSLEVQNFMLNKFNEVISSSNCYSKVLSMDDKFKLLTLILQMDEKIIRLIDSFDFTSDVPKIVIFLNKMDNLSQEELLLLGYLSEIGMDIIIFNPSGTCNIESIINTSRYNSHRLETMNYEATYSSIMTFTIAQEFASKATSKTIRKFSKLRDLWLG